MKREEFEYISEQETRHLASSCCCHIRHLVTYLATLGSIVLNVRRQRLSELFLFVHVSNSSIMTIIYDPSYYSEYILVHQAFHFRARGHSMNISKWVSSHGRAEVGNLLLVFP